MPWRGIYGFTRKDGSLGISSYAYVSIVNKSEGITEQAIARNLMVKVQVFGSKLRLQSEARVPWVSKDGKDLADRGELQPEDTLNVPVAVENKRQNKIVPFTPVTYSSSTPDDPYLGLTLDESLYLVKITFRGIGVYHVLWFALQNWVANPNVMGFYALGLFERTWVRLNLLGIGPNWEKYWERQQVAYNARQGNKWQPPS